MKPFKARVPNTSTTRDRKVTEAGDTGQVGAKNEDLLQSELTAATCACGPRAGARSAKFSRETRNWERSG